jgi:hypothetical protein
MKRALHRTGISVEAQYNQQYRIFRTAKHVSSTSGQQITRYGAEDRTFLPIVYGAVSGDDEDIHDFDRIDNPTWGMIDRIFENPAIKSLWLFDLDAIQLQTTEPFYWSDAQPWIFQCLAERQGETIDEKYRVTAEVKRHAIISTGQLFLRSGPTIYVTGLLNDKQIGPIERAIWRTRRNSFGASKTTSELIDLLFAGSDTDVESVMVGQSWVHASVCSPSRYKYVHDRLCQAISLHLGWDETPEPTIGLLTPYNKFLETMSNHPIDRLKVAA